MSPHVTAMLDLGVVASVYNHYNVGLQSKVIKMI